MHCAMIILSNDVVSVERKGVGLMDYRELLAELLIQATDEQLRRLYHFVRAYIGV